jgi:hypothetical protein
MSLKADLGIQVLEPHSAVVVAQQKPSRMPCICATTPSCQLRWLAQPRLHGLFVGKVLVFLPFKGK